MEQKQQSIKKTIDGIEDRNVRIGLWLSNLELILGDFDCEASVHKRLEKHSDALWLTFLGLQECQFEIQKLIEQALKQSPEKKAS